MRSKLILTLSVAAALAFSACPSKRNEVAKPIEAANSDTANATSPASPGGTAVVPSTEAGTTAIVALGDGTIALTNADAIPPGPVAFTVKNGGTQVHNLFIDGPGVQSAAGDAMQAGKTETFTVNLQPGTYTLYCPILDHRQKGESVQLIIKPPSAPAPTSTVIPGGTATSTTHT